MNALLQILKQLGNSGPLMKLLETITLNYDSQFNSVVVDILFSFEWTQVAQKIKTLARSLIQKDRIEDSISITNSIIEKFGKDLPKDKMKYCLDLVNMILPELISIPTSPQSCKLNSYPISFFFDEFFMKIKNSYFDAENSFTDE